MKTYIRSAAVFAAAMLAAVPAVAAEGLRPTPDPEPEVHVVNNHPYRIRVLLVDPDGRHHSLGRLRPSRAAGYDLDRFAIDGRPVILKVVVDEPVWSPAATGEAVRSRALHLRGRTEIRVWVEPDLTETRVEVRN